MLGVLANAAVSLSEACDHPEHPCTVVVRKPIGGEVTPHVFPGADRPALRQPLEDVNQALVLQAQLLALKFCRLRRSGTGGAWCNDASKA